MHRKCTFLSASQICGIWLSAAAIIASKPAAAGLFEDSLSGKTTVSSSETTPTETTPTETTPTETTPTETTAESTASGDGADVTAATSEESDAATASETAASTEAAAPQVVERIIERTGLAFDFSGHLRGDLFLGKMPNHSRVEIKNGYGELALKLKVSKSPYGDAFGDVRFQAGYLNDEQYLGQPTDTLPSGSELGEFDTRVKLREAYVNVYAGSHFDLKFGYQIIVWGRADGTNPTNNLTPIDLRVRSPQEDDRRLGNLAVRANLNFSPIRIEGVWVPIYAPSYMPQINLQRSADQSPIEFVAPDYPAHDISKGIYAGKIHLLLPQIEMSASYLYGHALQPGISYVDGGTTDAPTAMVRRAAYQHHVAGFDFSTVLGGAVGLRGEVAFKRPADYKDEMPFETEDFRYQVAVPNPEVFYVVGLDKEFGNVSLLGQYIGKTIINWKEVEPALIDSLTELTRKNRLVQGQTEKFQHAVSARVEWKTLHDTLSLSAFGMVNISTKEWLLYPKIAYSITDAMWLTVGGEIYQGPDESLFGYIEEILTAGYTELKIAF